MAFVALRLMAPPHCESGDRGLLAERRCVRRQSLMILQFRRVFSQLIWGLESSEILSQSLNPGGSPLVFASLFDFGENLACGVYASLCDGFQARERLSSWL